MSGMNHPKALLQQIIEHKPANRVGMCAVHGWKTVTYTMKEYVTSYFQLDKGWVDVYEDKTITQEEPLTHASRGSNTRIGRSCRRKLRKRIKLNERRMVRQHIAQELFDRGTCCRMKISSTSSAGNRLRARRHMRRALLAASVCSQYTVCR
jgi:hypothetical protein